MWRFRKPCSAKKMQNLAKKTQITNKRTSRTRKHKLFKLNIVKILNSNKCNMQRIKTTEKRFLLLLCGDIELNPGPINALNRCMSILTARLAHLA